MRRGLMCLVACGALMLSSAAHAILANCTVAGTGIVFPTYVSPGGGNADSSGTIGVTCTGLGLLVTYTIQLSSGSGSFAHRTLVFASVNALAYNMYTDTTRLTIWGDGTAGTSTVSDSYLLSIGPNLKNYTVYGRVPAGQNQPAGTYTDQITITITF